MRRGKNNRRISERGTKRKGVYKGISYRQNAVLGDMRGGESVARREHVCGLLKRVAADKRPVSGEISSGSPTRERGSKGKRTMFGGKGKRMSFSKKPRKNNFGSGGVESRSPGERE